MRYREILLKKMSKMERDIQLIKEALNIPDQIDNLNHYPTSSDPLEQDELPFTGNPPTKPKNSSGKGRVFNGKVKD